MKVAIKSLLVDDDKALLELMYRDSVAGPAGTTSLKAPRARVADYGVTYFPSFDVLESVQAYDVLGDDLGCGGVQDVFFEEACMNALDKKRRNE